MLVGDRAVLVEVTGLTGQHGNLEPQEQRGPAVVGSHRVPGADGRREPPFELAACGPGTGEPPGTEDFCQCGEFFSDGRLA